MSHSKQQPDLLLVDDEAQFRDALARRLGKRGFSTMQASGGEEALRVMATQPADVLILDVKMPGMDGITALGRIKAKHPNCEVILLTGQASMDDGVRGMKEGAFDYLAKPVNMDDLLVKIGQAWDKLLDLAKREDEARFRVTMEQRMVLTERLAAVGTLATGIAHEINNPLAIISESSGWLKQCMAKDAALSPDWVKRLELALGKIEQGVERMKGITHQLLLFARKTDWVVRESDLSTLLDEIAEASKKEAAAKDIRLNCICPDEPITIWTDPNQLRQAVLNLVSNAMQAVEPGGMVEISLEKEGEQVALRVRDNGHGIPNDQRDKIFEPFFSTRPTGQGTGLGLSASRGIVEKLGGKIELESKIGAGSCFKITLPRRPGKECQTVSPPSGQKEENTADAAIGRSKAL